MTDKSFIPVAVVMAILLLAGGLFFTTRGQLPQKITSITPPATTPTTSSSTKEPAFLLLPEEKIYFGQGYDGQYVLVDLQSGSTQDFIPRGFSIENQYSYLQFPAFLILGKNSELFSYNLESKILKSIKTDPSHTFLAQDEEAHVYPSITEKEKFFIHIHRHDPAAIDESGMGPPPVLSSRSYFFDATTNNLTLALAVPDIDRECAEYDSKNNRFFMWPCGEGIGTSLPLTTVSIDTGKHSEVISLEEFGLAKDDVGAVAVHISNGLFFATDKGNTPKVVVLSPEQEVPVKEVYTVSEQVRSDIGSSAYPYSVSISRETNTIVIGGSNNLLLMRFDEDKNIFDSTYVADTEVYANFVFTHQGRAYYQGNDRLNVINLATWEVERSLSGHRGGEVTLFSSEAVSEESTTTTISEASMKIALPKGLSLHKSNEENRRGSFVSYDFEYSGERKTPYFSEIQFFSPESIKKFTDGCQDDFCFEGDYPDTQRYLDQKQALSAGEELPEYARKQFNSRDWFVKTFRCEGDFCYIREYMTFIGDTEVAVIFMLDAENKEAQEVKADQLFEDFRIVE